MEGNALQSATAMGFSQAPPPLPAFAKTRLSALCGSACRCWTVLSSYSITPRAAAVTMRLHARWRRHTEHTHPAHPFDDDDEDDNEENGKDSAQDSLPSPLSCRDARHILQRALLHLE